MPHNDYTTREKMINFSRRFNRNDADSYFPKQGSSFHSAPSDPSDIATSDSFDEPRSNTNTTPSTGLHPPTEKEAADAYATPSPSDAITNSTTTTPSSAGSRLSPQYALRPPLAHRAQSSIRSSKADFLLPDLPWLCGTWHVVASSLPMWRNKRNVRIQYTRLPGNKLDDLVTYQNLESTEIVSVRGVDAKKRNGSYVWRGQGWLNVATSRWEVLGWGGGGMGATDAGKAITAPDGGGPEAADKAEQWVVTYFARTLFTPGGIDIYSRKSAGLSPRTMRKLRTALTRVGATGKGGGRSVFGGPTQQAEFQKIASELFDVTRDTSRADTLEWRELSEAKLDELVGA